MKHVIKCMSCKEIDIVISTNKSPDILYLCNDCGVSLVATSSIFIAGRTVSQNKRIINLIYKASNKRTRAAHNVSKSFTDGTK